MLQFGLNNSQFGYTTHRTTATWKISAMIKTTTNGATNFPTNGGGGMLHHPHHHVGHHQQPDYQQSAHYAPQNHLNNNNQSSNRHRSPSKMTVGGGGGGGSMTAFPRCSCCPYGYHIDLDFINYCQSLGKADPSPGQKLRRDRRKARQSMEIMLGFQQQQQLDTLQMLPKVGETSEISTPTAKTVADSVFELENEQKRAESHVRAAATAPATAASTNEKRLASAFANNALADVVQDFEKTLERTRTKSTSAEPEPSPERMEEEARRRRTFDSRTATTRERFFSEYEQLHTRRGLVRDPSRYDNLVEPNVIAQTPVKDMDAESVKSSASSGGSELSTSALQYIREQMATSLNKIRDLEEQNKVIPLLQKELARLKEEKLDLERQQRATRSPFSPQRCSPVQLQSAADMMKPKLTMREVGIQHTATKSTTGTGTRRMDEEDVTEKLFTETEVRRLLEEAAAEAKRSEKTFKDSRSIGLQMDSPKEECLACLDHKEEKQKLNKIVKIPRGSQTEFKIKTASIGVTARPETKSVGSSDHSTKDSACDKCRTRKRTVACGPDVESTDGEPISLKSLDRVTGRSKSDLTVSMEALMSTSQTSVSSIGTQMGNTTRDAGCQSVGPVLSNKSSQSDLVVTKGKTTDTNGLVEWLDQGSNTEMVHLEAEVTERLRQTMVKPSKTKSTNTIGVASHEQGTNTLAVRMNETAANTEPVSQRDVAVEVQTTVRPPDLPKHVTVCCENVKDCEKCQVKIRELAKAFIRPQVTIPVPALTPPKVISPVGESPAGSSRIPRPSMSPMAQRRATSGAVLKRQDTYTVDMAGEERRAEEEDRRVKEPTNDKGLTSPAVDLIDEMGSPREEAQRSKVIESDSKSAIPTSDTAMSLVSELDEGRPAAAAEVSTTTGVVSKLAKKLELKTTTTSTQRVSKSPNSSRPSISEDELRKEFSDSNLPRKTARPSQGMMGALKVINDSLMKSMDGHSLLNANTIVRREWFQVSSSESADPLDVEDYLDCFEEFSSHLLRYMVNLTDANGNAAMHYAVSHGNFDIVSILLDSKVCNVNQMNNAGYTCVMLVSLVKLIESAHRHVVQRLFQMSDVNIKAKKHNQTALMLAVSHGNLDMVQVLIEAGADINIQDEDGSTALMCAAEHGKIDIVKLLLAQPDCDSSIQDVDGSTSLKIALDAGYRDIGILLYAHDHMSRHRSPHSTLPRKSKLSAGGSSSTPLSRYSPSASAPASPAPSKKYFDHRK